MYTRAARSRRGTDNSKLAVNFESVLNFEGVHHALPNNFSNSGFKGRPRFRRILFTLLLIPIALAAFSSIITCRAVSRNFARREWSCSSASPWSSGTLPGSEKRRTSLASALLGRANLTGLVLVCIEAKFCKKICVRKLSPRSTRCTPLHSSVISFFVKILPRVVQNFANFSSFRKCCEKISSFLPKFWQFLGKKCF